MNNVPSIWRKRLDAANRKYDDWSHKFGCDLLDDYYEGEQWYNTSGSFTVNRPYVTNLIYSTLKVKEANLLIPNPRYKVMPRPGNSDMDIESAALSSQLKEDVLNTLINNEKEHFQAEVEATFLDSFFRFGVFETGYAADWLQNPMAKQPILNVDRDDDKDVDEDRIRAVDQNNDVPDIEKIYFKHIPAKRFRIPEGDYAYLTRMPWVAYYEFYPVHELYNTKGLDLDKDAYRIAKSAATSSIVGFTEDDDDILKDQFEKVWHIFDLKQNMVKLFLDCSDQIIFEYEFPIFPISEIRWDRRTKGWYPIPPVFQWLSPQNEYNESRQMMREHRRRFTRKYQAIKGSVDADEKDKFALGRDGTIIETNREGAIKPIEDANLGSSVKEALVVSREDFNEVAGISSADRGRSDRTTATESQRIALKADARDSREEEIMKRFLRDIGRIVLITAQKRFSEPFYVQITSDPGEQLFGQVNPNPAFKIVQFQEFDDGYDFTIELDILAASPLRMQEEKQNFIEFLTIVKQFPEVALSPTLIRETAYRCNYRNERIIKEMQQMATLAMMGQIAGAQLGGEGGSNAAQTKAAQMTSPDQAQIESQLNAQVM